MTKVRNFAEITPNLPFTEYNFYEEFRESFEKTELGRMKKVLPLHEMAGSPWKFGLIFCKIWAHLHFSVSHYPKILHNLNMKNGRSDTPLN